MGWGEQERAKVRRGHGGRSKTERGRCPRGHRKKMFQGAIDVLMCRVLQGLEEP